nr:hypothetical protein [Brevibacillus laterosporus]
MFTKKSALSLKGPRQKEEIRMDYVLYCVYTTFACGAEVFWYVQSALRDAIGMISKTVLGVGDNGSV